jgi:hypothetical protein
MDTLLKDLKASSLQVNQGDSISPTHLLRLHDATFPQMTLKVCLIKRTYMRQLIHSTVMPIPLSEWCEVHNSIGLKLLPVLHC